MTDPSILPSQSYPRTFSAGQGGGSADFVTPYKLGSGVMRGTQIIQNTDGSKTIIGNLPGSATQYGISFVDPQGNTSSSITGDTYSFYDSSDNLVSKITGPTQFVYDPTTGKNIIQMGKLPDGTYGLAVAKAGFNVTDAFS